MKIKVKKRKILHISFAILLIYCVQFSINTFISFTQFSKKLFASIRNGESLGIAMQKSFLATKESEYKRDNIFVHKASAASPTCNISAPIAGATLIGNANVSASASGAAPISVQFLLDGVNLGSSDNTSPYGTSWNTTLSTSGTHLLSCTTTNTYGETTTGATVSVIVDNTRPVRSNGAPSSILSAGTTQTTISLTTDENSNCKYDVSPGLNFSSMANAFIATGSTTHTSLVSGLSNGNAYSYYVRCQDITGNTNIDDYVISFSVANPSSDVTAPSVPQNASGAAASSSQVDLMWSAAADNVAVTGYKIYRDNVEIATTNNLNYLDNSVAPLTSYQYAISAYDAAANESAKSNVVSIQTPAAPVIPITPAVAVVAESESDNKEKDQPTPNRVIKQNYSKIKRGATLIQSGKRFSKNSFVDLYFSRLDLSYYPPVRVKTNSKGAFSMNYVARKAVGKYKWYAVDVKSGCKSKIMRYEITTGATKKQSGSSSKTTKSSSY